MSKLSCKKYDLMIDDYIDGLLSEDERRKLEAHLSTCENCRSSLRFSLALRDITRATAVNLPEGLHERIMDSVSEEKRSKKLGSRRKILRLGAVSAACMLLCLCCTVVFLMLPGNRKSESGVPDDDPIYAPEADNAVDEQTQLSQSDAPSTDSVPEEELPKDEAATDAEVDHPAPGEPASTNSVSQGSSASPGLTAATPEAIESVQVADTVDKPATDAKPDVTPDDEAEEAPEKSPEINSSPDGAPPPSSAESSRPGGEEITLALLIVSGLLAVASFIAFLISLSSIRTHSSNKENEKK